MLKFWGAVGADFLVSVNEVSVSGIVPGRFSKGHTLNWSRQSNVEQFSVKCSKTKTKLITLDNLKGHRKSSELIKTRIKCM